MKAIIFDLDGTILDTLNDIADAANEVLRKHNYSVYAPQDYKKFIGSGAKILFMRATNKLASESKINLLVKEFKLTYAKQYTQKTHKYAGISELFDWLDSEKISYAVLSNKPHELVVKLVKEFFPNRTFSAVFGQQESAPIKPNPTQVHKIISILNCNPHDVIFVGDSCVDIQTAKNASLFAVGAAWGFHSREELLSCDADIVADSPGDFQKMLLKMLHS